MFTPPVTRLFNIKDSDVGRPITDFTHHLSYEDIERDVRKVLRDLAPIEEEIRGVGDRWIMVRVRPYRTIDNSVDGVVVTFDDITERRRAEVALRENEEQLRAVFETALDYAIFTIDPAGAVTRWSPGAEAIFGWSESEIVGREAAMLFVLEDREAGVPEQELAGARESGASEDVRWHLRKDGSKVFIQGVVRSLGPLGFAKIGQDVTEQKTSETAVQESEERLRQFGDASQDILWVRDVATLQWQYLTPAFEETYGLTRAEALEGDNFRNWLELIVPEDREHAAASIARVGAGEHVTFEYRIRRPVDGQVRWLRDVDFPIVDKSDGILLIGGVGHDVTNLKAVEAALANIERRQRALIEGVPQLVWTAVDGGHWTWASPQWTAFTGQKEEDSLGRGWLDAVHPDDIKRVEDEWEGAVERGEFQAEYRLRHVSDISWRWVQTRATPVRDEHGAIVEWLGTSTDVDDLRRMQERQDVLVAELQHRTRNLMAVVRSMSDKTARASADLPEFRVRFRDRLEALSRVQGMLSRLNVRDRVSFDELIRTELTAMDGDAERVTLSGPDGVRLRSSTVQTLAMALHELATNAVKYGALGQPNGRLAIKWWLEGSGENGEPWLRIDWSESGVEMPLPDAAPRGTGHGRELIEQALPYQLSAKTTYSLGPEGVHCTIAIPVSASSEEVEHD